MNELQRLANACLFPSFDGPEAPEWIHRGLDDGFGGICLFASNVQDREQLAALTASLRAERGDVLIGIDEEGGDVTRLEWAEGSSYPGNLALGIVDDVALTERVAVSIGSELAEVGVDLDFAPVADVNVNPENPVIGVRSFGSEPELVGRHVAAFVRGLQSRGVAACAKHFPGHGATSQDSHLELPTVEGDVEPGLVPFRAAIAAGVQTIMTAHVRVATLDDAPATLSPRVLSLLRDELGFDGVVIADALEMKAIADTVGIEDGAVRSLAAGADALLVGRFLAEESVERIRSAIVSAVESGRLPEARLREAAARVARAAAWTAPHSKPRDLEAACTVARGALLVEGDVSVGAAPVVVELRPDPNVAAGPAEHSLGSLLPGARASVLGPEDRLPSDSIDVLVVRDAHRHRWMQVEQPDLVVVEIGLPVWRPSGVRGYIATRGVGRVNLEAAVEQLAAPVPAR
jgi:beta-N-acetylhexosaminidase